MPRKKNIPAKRSRLAQKLRSRKSAESDRPGFLKQVGYGFVPAVASAAVFSEIATCIIRKLPEEKPITRITPYYQSPQGRMGIIAGLLSTAIIWRYHRKEPFIFIPYAVLIAGVAWLGTKWYIVPPVHYVDTYKGHAEMMAPFILSMVEGKMYPQNYRIANFTGAILFHVWRYIALRGRGFSVGAGTGTGTSKKPTTEKQHMQQMSAEVMGYDRYVFYVDNRTLYRRYRERQEAMQYEITLEEFRKLLNQAKAEGQAVSFEYNEETAQAHFIRDIKKILEDSKVTIRIVNPDGLRAMAAIAASADLPWWIR